MIKKDIIAKLTIREFSNGQWLCTPKGRQVIKVGACEPLYKTEYIGPYRHGPYVKFIEVYIKEEKRND